MFGFVYIENVLTKINVKLVRDRRKMPYQKRGLNIGRIIIFTIFKIYSMAVTNMFDILNKRATFVTANAMRFLSTIIDIFIDIFISTSSY